MICVISDIQNYIYIFDSRCEYTCACVHALEKRDWWLQHCATLFVFDLFFANGWVGSDLAKIYTIEQPRPLPDAHSSSPQIANCVFIFCCGKYVFPYRDLWQWLYGANFCTIYPKSLSMRQLFISYMQHAWQPWAWPWKCHEQMAERVYDNVELD